MVTFIPENPSFGQQVSRGLGGGLGQGFAQAVSANQENRRALQLAQQRAKPSIKDLELDNYRYDTIKKLYGDKAASLYKAATEGGKTAILNHLIDLGQRDLTFGESLPIAEKEEKRIPEKMENFSKIQSKKLDIPDYSKPLEGFTPKEWANVRSGWSKQNNEILSSSKDRLKANKRDVLGTKKLQQLNESEKLPEGLERWLINPHTGEIYGIAQLAKKAPKAAQEWVKEIARFGNRAKDAFGSRVTNFDLSQYMKQFPSLMNTAEGRKSILRMMEINYQLDSLYDSAVQKIIDQKGSLNIPPEEVDRIARDLIKDQEEVLTQEYLNIDENNESSFLREGMQNDRPSLEEIFG